MAITKQRGALIYCGVARRAIAEENNQCMICGSDNLSVAMKHSSATCDVAREENATSRAAMLQWRGGMKNVKVWLV